MLRFCGWKKVDYAQFAKLGSVGVGHTSAGLTPHIAPTVNIAASTVITALTWPKIKGCMFYITPTQPETA